MPPTFHPLVDKGWQRHLKLGFLEFGAMLVAVGLCIVCGIAFAFGFGGWALGDNCVPPVAGVFLLWLCERTRGNVALLILVVCLVIFNFACSSHDAFLHLLLGLPVAIVSGYIAVQVFRYSRGWRNRRLVAGGASYILYLRPSMADEGPFFRFECNLVSVLAPIGLGVMLSERRIVRKSGIARLDWWKWQDRIGELIDHASLVVCFVMPRRGVDQPGGVDLFWEELENDAVRKKILEGRVVLFFREGWANRSLPCINKNGAVRFGNTSLMAEVHRVFREMVSVKWPEDLGRARFLWFAPGAKPQSLGVFSSSLGARRRIVAELSPVLEQFGARPKRQIRRVVMVVGALAGILWIGTKMTLPDYGLLTTFKKQSIICAVTLWLFILAVAVGGMRRFRQWMDFDYGNFVLHDKYRYKDWRP